MGRKSSIITYIHRSPTKLCLSSFRSRRLPPVPSRVLVPRACSPAPVLPLQDAVFSDIEGLPNPIGIMKRRWFEITALLGALVVGFHILFQRRLKDQPTPDYRRRGSVREQAPDRLLDKEAPPLPLDVLLEIFVRSDPATVARCGATCKLLRRHVADPAFLRRLRGASSASDRFLVGVLYHRGRPSWGEDVGARLRSLFAAPKASPAGGSLHESVIARLSDELAGAYDPIASGGGLLVLRRGQYYRSHTTTLCVCDPVGGRTHVLPPREICEHLLLVTPEEDEGNDGALGGGDMVGFKVFIADHDLRTQAYSSKAGAWGPVTDSTARLRIPGDYEHVQPSPVVLGGVAHWLYRKGWDRIYRVLALGVGTGGQAAWIEVPPDCHRRRRATYREVHRELLLVSSADGNLALLVWELPLMVSMWTMSSSSGRSWARRVVIDRIAILRSVQPTCDPLGCLRIEFQWFAQGSATVVFYMNSVGTVLLNLRTLEVRHLQRWRLECFDTLSPLCVYELDMISLFLPSR